MAIVLYKWLFLACLFSPQIQGSLPFVKESAIHPFYVSVTEVNHNAIDKNLEISCKVFTDDFESTLSKNYNTKVDLFQPKDKALVEKLISDYIKKHLVIKLNGKPVALEFVGFEREEEAIWSYFQVSNTPAPAKIEIMNNMLYDAFDKQINLMHVSVGGHRKSTKLNYPDVNAKFEF